MAATATVDWRVCAQRSERMAMRRQSLCLTDPFSMRQRWRESTGSKGIGIFRRHDDAMLLATGSAPAGGAVVAAIGDLFTRGGQLREQGGIAEPLCSA